MASVIPRLPQTRVPGRYMARPDVGTTPQTSPRHTAHSTTFPRRHDSTIDSRRHGFRHDAVGLVTACGGSMSCQTTPVRPVCLPRLQAVPRGLIAGTHPSVCREPTASLTHSHTTPLPHTCVARTVFSAALLSCLPPSLPTPALAPRAASLSPPLRHDLRLLLPPNMAAGRFTYPGKPPESAGCFHVLDIVPGIQSVPQPAVCTPCFNPVAHRCALGPSLFQPCRGGCGLLSLAIVGFLD
jgi:hypothetical protein